MFIKAIKDETNNIYLAFLKSLDVQVFPCGRRRSTEISNGTDTYHIPFDPESRLNTEDNNRKHVGINNTQTFIDSWKTNDTEQNLSLVLAGYVFTISRDDTNTTAANFATNVIEALKSIAADSEKEALAAANKIYANIRIEKSLLLDADFAKYKTWILRNQSATTNPTYLDQLKEVAADSESADNYYFSGLSFSTQPLTCCGDDDTHSQLDILNVEQTELYQRVVSLCILDKSTGDWNVHQPALLPELKHGDTAGSIEVGDVDAANIRADGNISANDISVGNKIRQQEKSVPSVQLKNLGDTYQLQFFNVDKLN